MVLFDSKGNPIGKKPEVKKGMDEKTYRFRLREEAKYNGCEKELLQLFDKFDALLRNCTNAQEAAQIGTLGVLEVSKLLDGGHVGAGGSLVINGQVILSEPEPNKE